MSAYQTIVVGTDGSDSSLRAVDRAASIAADHDSTLIVATAHPPTREEHGGWSVPPGSTHGQDYRVVGSAPIYRILQDARERAHKAGAKNVQEKSIVGAPISALVHLAEESRCRPAGGRQRRTQQRRRAAVGISPVRSLPQSQDGCADRPHHRLKHPREAFG